MASLYEALFGPAPPPSFDDRWAPVRDIPQFAQQIPFPRFNQDVKFINEAKDRGWEPYTKWLSPVLSDEKYNDTQTKLDNRISAMRALLNRNGADGATPSLDPNTLMQLLNPGQAITPQLPTRRGFAEDNTVQNPQNYMIDTMIKNKHGTDT